MNINSINYVDQYAIISDRALKTAYAISQQKLSTNIKTVFEVLSFDSGFSSLNEAIDVAKKMRCRNGVNVIAICEEDFEDNGFVVARVSRNGTVDTMEDL